MTQALTEPDWGVLHTQYSTFHAKIVHQPIKVGMVNLKILIKNLLNEI